MSDIPNFLSRIKWKFLFKYLYPIVCIQVSLVSLVASETPSQNIMKPAYNKRVPRVEFVIVIPSYNNQKWVERNLNSLLSQEYKNWHLYYINDCSTDRTKELVNAFVKKHRITHKSTIVHNTIRKGALANLYTAIHSCNPNKIIVTVDGDDYLADNQVLSILAKIYQNKKIWMTYGNFKSDPPIWPSCCGEYPKKIAKNNTFRKHAWFASHLRTFRAKLFQKIRKQDLMYKGDFFKMTWDFAIMFPMLEMSRKNHFLFIKRVLYRYNISNPISDFRVNEELLNFLDKHIRSLKPYHALNKL